MKCFNCGGEYRHGTKICPHCGISFEEYYVNEEVFRSGNSKGKKRKSKNHGKSNGFTAVICVAMVVVIGLIVAMVLLMAESKKTPETKYICALCDNEVAEDEHYCDDCKDSKFCKICEKEIEEGDVFCKKCKKEHTCKDCGVVKDYIEDYCISCEKKLPGCGLCGKRLKDQDAVYCDKCLEEANIANQSCFGCHRPMGDEKDYYISKESGYVFCSKCDSGKYCKKCLNPIGDGNSDGTHCNSCKTYECFGCGKEVTGNSAALISFNEHAFCTDCDTGRYCSECLAPVTSDGICKDCGHKEEEKFTCLGCRNSYGMSSASYAVEDGYYCSSCDTGIYCNRCPVPVTQPGLCKTCADPMNPAS